MQVNPSKIQFKFLPKFTSKEIRPQFIEVYGSNIPCKNEVKLLGITIDDKLKFDKKVDILCKNAARQLTILYRFKGIFEKIQERALRFMFNDKKSSYSSLLKKMWLQHFL